MSVFFIIHNIMSLFILFLQSTWRVNQSWFVEWFILVISISILTSNNISMSIFLSFPRSFIEKLSVSLESTCNCTHSVSFIQSVIKFTVLYCLFLVSIRFCSFIWFQISFSERCTPFLMEGWMRSKTSFFTISSEEMGSSLIKASLIGHETIVINKI